MNIVDYIIIGILLINAFKGFKDGLLPSVINLVGEFLIFLVAFYLKEPISVYLYENLPFFSFGGIFKGVVAINILFYEAIAYFVAVVVLSIVFAVLKKVTKLLEKILRLTIFLNLPSKICGAIVGAINGVLISFLLLYICSIVNTTTKYVNESKYASIILKDIPIINNVASDFVNSVEEVYNTLLHNKNDTNKANLESIDILMKYDILSYDSANNLINDNKLNIENIDTVISKYKGE